MSQPPISEETLSERFDSLPNLEQSDLTDDQSKLVDEWTQLRSSLKQLPEKSVSLVSGIRSQIEEASLVVAARQSPEKATPRQSAFALLASSLTIAACLFSLMYFPAPVPNLTFRQSMYSGFTPSELVSGLSDCDVVMITMPNGAEEATDFLKTSLTNRGMESHPIAIDSQSPSNSQLLGSNADSAEVLGALTALENAIGGEPVDDMEREEILNQLLEAIETPSLAEEHFNDYVVVLPRDVIDEMRKGETAVADLNLPKKEDSPPGDVALVESRKVVFVVRRKKVVDSDSTDSNGADLQSNSPAADLAV